MNFRIKFLSILLIGFSVAVSSCKKDDEVFPFKRPVFSSPDNGGEATTECPSGTPGETVDGQYIVLFKNSAVSAQNFSTYDDAVGYFKDKGKSLLQKYGVTQPVRQVFASGVKGFAAVISPEKVARLKNDPEVEIVEQDKFIGLPPVSVLNTDDSSRQLVPYGINRVGYANATTKTAWILDTGIDLNHPDLNVDQVRSKNFVCGEASATDENGHGTHVAGTIAAKNNNIGVVGVAPGNIVVAVKVMGSDGKGTVSNLIAGLDYVYKNAKPGDVVNMSLSGGSSQTLDKFVYQIATEKKVFFAVAAGNETKDAGTSSPQRVESPYVFTISAMDENDKFASFSNFGSCVDYCAPGVKIASTYKNGSYAYLSGTSMATPHFAGLLLINGKTFKIDGTVKDDPDGSADPIAIKNAETCL